ncbi:MAG: acyl carrier protein [Steroidobacteraceae bacterium]
MSDIRQQLRSYIEENFIVSASASLTDSDSLLDKGVVDSTGFIELITYLEERFAIEVRDDEMIPENLDSIDNLTTYVDRKLQAAATA